ncbi:MAG: DUF3500 domain-containing protein [Rhodospirillales bacterium]|nr:DUF3500 domain-containing protein [Rhodospirillales bacterium]
MASRRALLGASGGLLVGLAPGRGEARIAERMADAARALLAAVDERGRRAVSLAFAAPEREDWHYVPRRRAGLTLREMGAPARAAAAALLEAGLGDTGVRRVEGVRRLEGILREREGAWRDPDNYALAVHGDPATPPWAWRFEGHHLSLHFTIVAPDRIAVTPAFWGANPARTADGFRLMGAVEDSGKALLRSLDEAARREAVIGERSLGDIVAGPGRESDLGAPRGVALSRLGDGQRDLAVAIARGFLDAVAPDLAAARLKRLRETEWSALRFAWAGPMADGRPFYFRLHGPATLLELDNTQNDANHVHSVWRDLGGDFGRDALAEHYRKGHR